MYVVNVEKLFQQMLILLTTLEHTLGRNLISALKVANLIHRKVILNTIWEYTQVKKPSNPVFVTKGFLVIVILWATWGHIQERSHIIAVIVVKLSQYKAFKNTSKGIGFLNVAIVIKLLLRIVIYEIILECIQEKNHLQAADVAKLLHRKVIWKSIWEYTQEKTLFWISRLFI